MNKFTFLLEWAESKKSDYHPKSLFLTIRYALILVLETVEEELLMNFENDTFMERNFQAITSVIGSAVKYIPAKDDELSQDSYGRVMLNENMEIAPVILPFFKGRWADSLICEKYFLLFKKFFSTKWYLSVLSSFERKDEDYLKK